MKPSEILDNAASIILQDGWYQGAYYKEAELVGDGKDRARDEEAKRSAPCCQAGAISRAIFGVAWRSYDGHRHDDIASMAAAEKFMRNHVLSTYDCRSPIEWNDQPERTAEQVVEALRGAAELARGEGR